MTSAERCAAVLQVGVDEYGIEICENSLLKCYKIIQRAECDARLGLACEEVQPIANGPPELLARLSKVLSYMALVK